MIDLRDVQDEDLDALFEQMCDPVSVAMAAFTPEDPDDRARFDAHMARVRKRSRDHAAGGHGGRAAGRQHRVSS